MSTRFTVETVQWTQAQQALQQVRETVFVQGQGVPAELEQDGHDSDCQHVLARDSAGTPIGTARLSTDGKLGRMAVLDAWRGHGVGEALLDALVQHAHTHGAGTLYLHAQASAVAFYLQHGWLPQGETFTEAGIEHQRMCLPLRQATLVSAHEHGELAAHAALCGVVHQARRQAYLFVPSLAPALFNADAVQNALRRLATRRGDTQIQLLLHGIDRANASAATIALVQRLPSSFAVRITHEGADRQESSAWMCNDIGGSWHWPQADRMAGQYQLDAPGQARLLRQRFDVLWQRAQAATELRALGL